MRINVLSSGGEIYLLDMGNELARPSVLLALSRSTATHTNISRTCETHRIDQVSA
jgi:hypothetical protein